MKTGAHILQPKQIGSSASSWGFRATCSCGVKIGEQLKRAGARELHDIHVQEAIELERAVQNA